MDTLDYTKRYADTYCNGDTEEAGKHAIVREVAKGESVAVDEYARLIYGEDTE